MLRISSLISLAIAVLLLGLAVFLWLSRDEPGRALVQDDAGLMTRDQRAFITRYHDYLLKDHDIDYRVITARGLDDINSAAVTYFETLAETIRSESGRGLLLLIDADADLVRLEVGYALEGAFPDAFAAYVEHRQMVPFFERTRVADGILATTELIITRAQRAAANAGFEGEAWIAGSGGAGATTSARLGAGRRGAVTRGRNAATAAGHVPAETLKTYFDVLAARNADPNLKIYTPATRQMLQSWVMTPAQMDNVVRTYRRCRAEAPRISDDGRYAVIRYPSVQRACAPFFFERVDARWALDLTMMQRAVRFGRSNAWRFDLSAQHPYRFAFEDWRFDRNGFPRSRQ
jgi:uncharacterized protein